MNINANENRKAQAWLAHSIIKPATKVFINTSTDMNRPCAALPDLVPARMVNEYAYCPRLCFIEWVEGEFAENADTVEGTFQHRRVDREQGSLSMPSDASEPDSEDAPIEDSMVTRARSVLMSAPEAGLIARMDMVEERAGCATPVDVKRGAAPDIPEGAYEPERVQLCAQGIILRENGYTCEHGELYFARSRCRVRIPLDQTLTNRTLELLAQMRAMAASGVKPPPLEASVKCPRCSLVGVCLPDETNVLLSGAQPEDEDQVLVFSLGPAESYNADATIAIGKPYDFVQRHAVVV